MLHAAFHLASHHGGGGGKAANSLARLIKGPVRAVLILRSKQQKIHKTNFLRGDDEGARSAHSGLLSQAANRQPHHSITCLFLTQGRAQSANEKEGKKKTVRQALNYDL